MCKTSRKSKLISKWLSIGNHYYIIDVQTDIQTDVQTDIQTDVQTDIQTDVPKNLIIKILKKSRQEPAF